MYYKEGTGQDTKISIFSATLNIFSMLIDNAVNMIDRQQFIFYVVHIQ